MPTKDKDKRKEQWKKWYDSHKNDESYKTRIRKFDDNRRKLLVLWFNELKSQLQCINCGINHPAVLDFHHRLPEEKEYDVGTMPFRSISKKKILQEIKKCDVYCSNCHRILHWNKKHGDVA